MIKSLLQKELSQIESVNPHEVIEGLVYQFGYEDKGKIHTGGLSALENAFDYLGWDDPHVLPTHNQV